MIAEPAKTANVLETASNKPVFSGWEWGYCRCGACFGLECRHVRWCLIERFVDGRQVLEIEQLVSKSWCYVSRGGGRELG